MQTLRIVLLLCVAAFVPAAGGALGAEMVAPLRLRFVDDMVEVRDANGRFMQAIPHEGELPDQENGDIFTFVADLDFDGFPDVGVLSSRGMYNLFYDCWLWRPDRGRFEKHDELTDLPNLRVLPERKRLLSCMHGCAVSHLAAEYAWENGRLTVTAQTEQDYAKDGKGVVVRRYERGEGEELRLVSERALTAGAPDGKKPAADGLNLFPGDLPGDARLVEGETFPDGSWRLRHGFSGAAAFLHSRRTPALGFEIGEAEKLVLGDWPEARDIRVEPFPALSEKLTYPVFKVGFSWGENEDARRVVAALIFADEWSFWFAVEASADAGPLFLPSEEQERVDAAELGGMLEKDMERVLLSVGFDAPDDQGLFGIAETSGSSVAPTCGDDALEVRFLNLSGSAIRNMAVLWRSLSGGGRFAWLEAETEPDGWYEFSADEGRELIGVSVDFGERAFRFGDLSRLVGRQKMMLDITLDANGRPHLTLQENKDAQERASDGAYIHEWINVVGKLHVYDK